MATRSPNTTVLCLLLVVALYLLEPYATDGSLSIEETGMEVPIERIQMEIDSGKATDVDGRSVIDMNRAGVGLLEVVTAPIFRSAHESVLFAKKLQAMLKDAHVCEGGLESGQFRVDVNVSVTGPDAPKEAPPLGVRVEIKNLNSFAAVSNAIEHETKRHIELLRAGHLPKKETRGFNSVTKETFHLRSKEESHDYRFIRDYDIPRITVSEAQLEMVRRDMPRTQEQRIAELYQIYGLSKQQAHQIVSNQKLLDLFQSIMQIDPALNCQFVFNWIMVDLIGQVHKLGLDADEFSIQAQTAADLLRLVTSGKVSRNSAKEVLSECLMNAESSPLRIAGRMGLLISEVSERDLYEAIQSLFSVEASKAKEVSLGERSLDYFMGPLMKQFKGRVQPQRLRKILSDAVDKLK